MKHKHGRNFKIAERDKTMIIDLTKKKNKQKT